MTDWRNRIVGYTVKRASELTANPANWRKHPQAQRDAVRASLNELGWIATVIENVRTGYLLDGHERVWQALPNDDEVPVLQVDLSEAEERLALATLDPLAALAETDATALEALLREVNTGEAALQQMLAQMAETVITPKDADWADAFGKLPEGDRAPFQQMTFTLHDTQAKVVKQAMLAAKRDGDFADAPNENSNGNALWWICARFLGSKHG